jgi:hypothetical protein
LPGSFRRVTRASAMEDFEAYLAKRRRMGKLLLVGAAVFVVGSVAIPYALMKSGLMTSDTFDIFVVFDVLLGAGAVRAGIMRLKDGGKWEGPVPFS